METLDILETTLLDVLLSFVNLSCGCQDDNIKVFKMVFSLTNVDEVKILRNMSCLKTCPRVYLLDAKNLPNLSYLANGLQYNMNI